MVDRLAESQKTILKLIKENPYISKKELSEPIGILYAGGEDEDWVLCTLRAFENNQMGNPKGIVFLQKMLTELPVRLCKAHRKIVAMLQDFLGRRVVAISD